MPMANAFGNQLVNTNLNSYWDFAVADGAGYSSGSALELWVLSEVPGSNFDWENDNHDRVFPLFYPVPSINTLITRRPLPSSLPNSSFTIHSSTQRWTG
jgi:hypothetical protein